MTGLGESLWLENMESHEGKNEQEEEEGKESLKEKKDPGCFPVFIRSLTGRTLKLLISPHADVLTLLSMVEGLVHIPRHHWYVRANGKPLPDFPCHMGFCEMMLLRCMADWLEVLPLLESLGSGFARCVNVEGAGQRDLPVFGVDVLARIRKP